jgi:hypothetical protein
MNLNSHDANNSIKTITEKLRELSKKAIPHLENEVHSLIHNAEKDDQRIENLLDELLNYCYDEKVLMLFKKLCRYYLVLNPEAVTGYVQFYREMWDCESIPSPSGRGQG